MSKLEKGMDIAKLGLIALLAYFIIKSFKGLGEWWKGGFEQLYGTTLEKEQAISVPPEVVKQNYESIYNPETLKILEYTSTQPAQTTLINQYKQNITDFTNWARDEQIKNQEAQKFIAINSVNPFFMLNPFNQVSMDNAEAQLIDSQYKIDYYKKQIEINRSKLNQLGVWI